MSIGTAAAIGLGVTSATGLASSLIGSSASKSAAQAQEQAAEQSIAEQQREFNIQQQNMAPWLQAGQQTLPLLTAGTQPGGQFVTPYGETWATPAPFTAPTNITEQNDPGYQARLAAGLQAVQRGQAAGGGAFSGGTLKALSRYGQDYASNEYSNVYNRALGTYDTNTQNALQSYLTRYNAYNTDQTNIYNRLASLSGIGQTAAGQLSQAGQASTANITSLLTGIGNAQAAGTLGGASAWNAGLGGLTGGVNNALNAYQQGGILNLLTGGGGWGTGNRNVYDPTLSMADPGFAAAASGNTDTGLY
jgi:hypothetical protein